MAEQNPAPPSGLGERGRRFWRQVTERFDLGPDEAELLVEVSRALDEAERLHQVVEKEGGTAKGSRGQVVVHPTVSELRQTRLMLGRLLSQLQLPDEDGQVSLPSGVQARGRRAAARRWGGERRGTA